MIDKFDSKLKLIELTYLNNFGINLDIHKQLNYYSIKFLRKCSTFQRYIKKFRIKKIINFI